VLAADRPAQRHPRRGTERADVDARCREGGRLGGDREIAGRDKLTAGRGGEAMHLRDHRLRQPRDRQHHPAAAREERLDLLDASPGPTLLEAVAVRYTAT